MREALALARRVLLPRFQDAATERAFITERFSATYGATMTYFLILAILTTLALPFAEGFLGRCRLGTLLIGFIFVLIARHQHRPSRFPDRYLASRSFATCAASFCFLVMPLAKFIFPQSTLAPHFIAAMHFLSIIVVRHHCYPTTQRLAIHFGIFLADLEGSRLLTGSALAVGELVGSIFENDLRHNFSLAQERIEPQAAQKGDGSQGGGSQGTGGRIDDDTQQLIEALRASNERREYEIPMLQQSLAGFVHPKWDDTALSPELFKPRNSGSMGKLQAAVLPRSTCSDEEALSSQRTESELPLGVEANSLRHRVGGTGGGAGTGQANSHATSVEASISESVGVGSHATAKIGRAFPQGEVPNTTMDTTHHRNHLTALWYKIRARRSFRWM
jgi:hypothetical protein